MTNTIPQTRERARCPEAARAVGGAAARTGDSQHPRGDVGLLAVRVSQEAQARAQVFKKRRNENDVMASATLEATTRESRGKNEARRLRVGRPDSRRSSTAAPAAPCRARSIPRRCRASCTRARASTRIIEPRRRRQGVTQVLVKEFLLEPITHSMLHADFYRLQMDKAITVTVVDLAEGRAEGRQAPGRRRRLPAPRGRSRVPAGRHPGAPDHRRVSELMIGQGVRLKDLVERRQVDAGEPIPTR